ncbi:MAG: uroporphyrinogen decarboxylase family protein [Candidatus Bathyarchaeia archaeon]|jgi:hypothetical protein
MMRRLSSRERLLAAINHSEVDYVPFYQKFWHRGCLSTREDAWRDQFERARKTTRLGLEDTVGFEIPRAFSPEVKIIRRKETLPGEETAYLTQEYQTPKGSLTQIVRQTRDWPHGDNVPIFTDYVVPRGRSRKYLVENMDDVEALSCLFSYPDEEQLRRFEDQVSKVRCFAEENQLLVESGATFSSEWLDGDSVFLGDALHWLCGFENSVILARRNPDLMHRLLDVISDWSLQSIRLITQFGGCDVIMHRGWYECFWSPKLYQTFLAPRIKKEVDLTHRAGAKFCYVMTSGIMPFLGFFKEMGVDILYGVDPVQGNADLQKVKETLRGQVCIWGGVNSVVTLTGSKQGVVKAVEEAIRILEPDGGFILGAIDQLFEDTIWDNFMTMIHTWRKLTGAPNQI